MNPFRLITVASSRLLKMGRAQGDSVITTAQGDDDRDYDSEFWATHGIVSRPAKTTRCLRFRLGSLSIVIAAYTYGVEPPANPGAVKVYSTNADGAEQGSHLIDDDGTHTFNEGAKLAARKSDTVKLSLTSTDIQALAVALLATGAFTPTGSPPAPGTPTVFTGGEITSGTNEVLLP